MALTRAPAAAPLAMISQDVMAALDRDGRIVWANPAWRRVLGWAPDELAGRRFADLVHPDDAPRGAALADAGEDGVETAVRMLTHAGSARRMAVGALGAPAEGLVYVCGRDATQALEAEQELRAAEDRFRSVTEATGEGILTMDARGRITFANGATSAIFGWQVHEMLGQPVTMLFPERHRGLSPVDLAESLLGRTVPAVGLRRDGTEVPLEVSLGSYERGGLQAFTGILRDVTALREAQRASEQRAVELERSNAELAEFAYVASHDLSEPLRMISSYLQLLRRRHGDALEGEADEFVSRAVEGATRMRSLIEDLLAYSRAGRAEQPAEPVDMEAVLASVVRSLPPDAGAVEHDPLPTVPGQPNQLAQLLQNLLSNGMKFVAPGARPRVHVSAERDGDAWRFAVDDNGIGIELRHAERIFGMFQRLHTREAFPGTGIGLAIARKVVERHGGRIWAEPRPEGGTRVAFTLPA